MQTPLPGNIVITDADYAAPPRGKSRKGANKGKARRATRRRRATEAMAKESRKRNRR